MEWKRAELKDGLIHAYVDVPSKTEKPTYTILALHGIAFNSNVWRPLIKHKPDNVRFIAYNQRGYKGSSEALKSGTTAGSMDVTFQLFLDMLYFIKFCVDELGVEPVTQQDGHNTGGISLMGWSKGTTQCLILLSTIRWLLAPDTTSKPSVIASSIPKVLLSVISSHLQSVILLEPPASSFGIIPPRPDLIAAMGQFLSAPVDDNFKDFAAAFLAYFGAKTAPDKAFEMLHLPAQLLEESYQPECVPAGFAFRMSTSPVELQLMAKGALSPEVWPRAADSVLPERLISLPVSFMYGSRTIPYLLDVVELVESWWDNSSGQRKVMIASIPSAGHFTFVDQPAQCGQALLRLLEHS